MVRHGVAMIALALAAACSNPASPTPPVVPLPGCCALSGTVTETSPTASTSVPGATMTIMAGPNVGRSTVTDASGYYIFTQLQVGALTVRSSAAGYEDTFQTLTLTADRASFGFQLNPAAGAVDERHDDVVSAQDPVCASFDPATKLPCKQYSLAIHWAGEVYAVLNWDDRIELASALALELVRVPGTGPSDRIALSLVTEGNPNREEVRTTVPPGLYTLRVLYQRDLGPQTFTLTATHPR